MAKIFRSQYDWQADEKVYLVEYDWQADEKAYLVRHEWLPHSRLKVFAIRA